MLNYLIHLVERLGHWGYLVIFLGAMLESAAFLGVVIPGESLVLVAGFLAAQGLFDLDALIIVIAIGATLGDNLGYEMGRRLGRPTLLRYGSRVGMSQARLDKADRFFAKHGGKAVFLGRFVGFARALVPFLAGSARMRYRDFLAYNAVGAALWSLAITLLGYFLGASWHVAAGWIGRASAILGGMFLFGLALTWLWHWAVRHEALLRQVWQRALSHPWVVGLQRRFAPQLAFLAARLSPQGYLGLQLTLGVAILIGAGWLFGGIAEDVVSGDPLTQIDVQVAIWLHAHAAPLLTDAMLFVSALHGTAAICLYVGVLALYLACRRDGYGLTGLLLAVPGGMLLNVLLKHAFHRARPSFEHPLQILTSYSFPSGHVAASTLLYGFLVMLALPRVSEWRNRMLIILSAFGLVVLVAFSRLYLGVHYLSDVLAAFAEGIAWLALTLTGLHTFQRRRTGQGQRRGKNAGAA